MRVHIQEITESVEAVTTFESRERPIVDKEHRGDATLDFEKRAYTIAAFNDEQSVAGVVKMTIDSQTAHVDTLLVGEAFRRQWVGKELMLFAEEFAKKCGCYKIWLDTIEDRDAMEFYKALYYEETGILEKHYFWKNARMFTKFFSTESVWGVQS